ncbi:MAG: glycosyltransferase [Candidatus Eisenbacteria bacterium]
MIHSLPRTIVYLNRTAEVSGAEMSLLTLLGGLNRRIFRPVVILPGEGPFVERLRAIDVEVRIVRLEFIDRRKPLPYVSSVFRLARSLAQLQPALVHSNGYMCCQYGIPAAVLCSADFVSHVRLILSPRAIRNSLASKARLLIANSQAVAKALGTAGVPSRRIEVIHNAVDVAKFRPAPGRGKELRDSVGATDHTFLLGCIGRFHESKGQMELLEALSMLGEAKMQIRCVFFGGTEIDGSSRYLEQLRERARALGMSDVVRFFGFRDDIAGVYDAIDLLALPSREEPFGRVLIEAMAMKKPVLAVDAGGPTEIVRDGVDGFLVRDNTPGSLRAGVHRALENRQSLPQMGARGRDRVERSFSVEAHVQRHETLYLQRLLRERALPAHTA